MLKSASDYFRSKIPKKIKKNRIKKRHVQSKMKKIKKNPSANLNSDTVTVMKGKNKIKKLKNKTQSKTNEPEKNGKVNQKVENGSDGLNSKIIDSHDSKENLKQVNRANKVKCNDSKGESPNKKIKNSKGKSTDKEPPKKVLKGKVLKKKRKKKISKGTTDQIIAQVSNNTSLVDVSQNKNAEKINTTNAIDIQVNLNKKYDEVNLKTALTKSWSKTGYPLKIENTVEMVKKPFTAGHMLNFLNDTAILEGVKREVEELKLTAKNNDLYKFKQTTDLKNASTPYLSAMKKFLYGPFRKYLMSITGIELDKTVDIGSSLYEKTDVLLCHDDELEGRRIAFILYLVPPWEDQDGGTLDLFNADTNGQPADVAKSFCPVWNSFAFFEVSPVSFHQVSEVMADKKRLSINGWYHGSPVVRPPKYIEPPRPVKTPCHIEQEDLYSWINHVYLDPWTQAEIKKKFKEESEIELEQFLAEDKYEALLEAIKSQDLKWQYEGPANKRHYEVSSANKAGNLVRECLKFLRSEAVFLIISQLTGLRMHKLAPLDSEDDEEEMEKEISPRVSQEIRRWGNGSYTLVHDDDPHGGEYALDSMLFLGASEKWTKENGGFTSYIAKDEDEELLTVMPKSNSLCMVYRDKETLKFTKHINSTVLDLPKEEQQFYEVNCTYYE